MKQSQWFDSSLGYRRLAMLESVPEALFSSGHKMVVYVIRLIKQGTHVSFPLSRVEGMDLLLLRLFLNRGKERLCA